MEQLLREIRDYCAQAGMTPGTLGLKAVGDHKFFNRIASGRQCTIATAEKVRAFMAANPATGDAA